MGRRILYRDEFRCAESTTGRFSPIESIQKGDSFFQKEEKKYSLGFYVTFVPREEAALRLIDREIKGALVPNKPGLPSDSPREFPRVSSLCLARRG